MHGLRKISETIYESANGDFKLRLRKGRNVEVSFSNMPNVWTSAGTRDLREGLDYAKRCLKADMIVGKSHKITFAEYAKDFFRRTDDKSMQARDEFFGKKKSEGYYIFCQGRLENYLLPRFGKQIIESISDMEIERWYSSLISTKGRPLSPATKVKVLYTLDAIMESARRDGIIPFNPCKNVEKMNERIMNPRKPFTLSEIRIMFPNNPKKCVEIWGSLKWACYFSIMVDTGFRPGEVAGLRRENFIGNGVFSCSSVDSITDTLKDSIKTSRKGQSYKAGTLSNCTIKLLEMYIDTLPDSQELFFPNDANGLLDPATSNKHLRIVLDNLGIPLNGRSQYSIRHFFNTYMLKHLGEESMNTDDVRELMGHTGYRPEYDHRSPLDIVLRLEKVRSVIDKIRA